MRDLNKKTSSNVKYVLLLFVVTIVMGSEFPIIKIGLETIPPLLFIFIRFLLAGITLFLLYFKRIRKEFKAESILPAFVLSSFLFLGFLTANFGIKYTTATNSGFYISLVVIFTPILGWMIFKQQIKKDVLISVAIILIGIYLISTDSGTLNFNIGDLLCILSGLCYALQINFTSIYVNKHDPMVISILQILFVSLWGIGASLIFEVQPDISSIGLNGWMSLVFTGIAATAFVYTVQSFAQTQLSASNIGIIYSFEPVFSAILSAIMLGERLGLKGVVGGTLIVLSTIVFNLMSIRLAERELAA